MLSVKKGYISGIDSIEIINDYCESNDEIYDIINEIINSGGDKVIFNCKNMSYMTSMALLQLIKIIKIFKKKNGQIYFYGLKDEMIDLLRDTALDKYFKFL